MTNLTGGAPAPGFDNPLEMLEACHGRIQSQCATLKKLLQYSQPDAFKEQAAR